MYQLYLHPILIHCKFFLDFNMALYSCIHTSVHDFGTCWQNTVRVGDGLTKHVMLCPIMFHKSSIEYKSGECVSKWSCQNSCRICWAVETSYGWALSDLKVYWSPVARNDNRIGRTKFWTYMMSFDINVSNTKGKQEL